MSGNPRADWEKCRRKGESFLPWFSADEGAAAPASHWTERSQLVTYGWRRIYTEDRLSKARNLSYLLDDLLPNAASSHHAIIGWQHDGAFTNQDGGKGAATKAENLNEYYVEGLIVAIDNTSPAGALWYPAVLPDLQHWSDITWLTWARFAGDRAGDLAFVVRSNITNSLTEDVIDEVLRHRGEQLKRWPGHTFLVGTDDGNALLGTPNGAGVAFLLAQHRAAIRKKVDGIVVWGSEGGHHEVGDRKNLLFRLAPIGQPEGSGAGGEP